MGEFKVAPLSAATGGAPADGIAAGVPAAEVATTDAADVAGTIPVAKGIPGPRRRWTLMSPCSKLSSLISPSFMRAMTSCTMDSLGLTLILLEGTASLFFFFSGLDPSFFSGLVDIRRLLSNATAGRRM